MILKMVGRNLDKGDNIWKFNRKREKRLGKLMTLDQNHREVQDRLAGERKYKVKVLSASLYLMSPMERFAESINTRLIEGMMEKQCLYYCLSSLLYLALLNSLGKNPYLDF